MTSDTYKFKTGTHIPDGATAAGIQAERAKIEKRCGAATIDASAAEVLRAPKSYPNLVAFCPQTTEEAILIATKDAIRKAYKSVVFDRGESTGGGTREIRANHAIRGDSGDREYKTLEQIRNNPKDLKFLVGDLRREAASYQAKVENVLAEIENAL